ncbi:hypothetical protein HNY73_001860 [Argiope bruennichi]|uniref:Uncharacterized protein n=1 Tax=Argiope bruennichi TaxID=94029 RepID=A0A8T0FT54_ARGBR|nr:hypothetical protein HNY73_001860 [Argiope bruennichi]
MWNDKKRFRVNVFYRSSFILSSLMWIVLKHKRKYLTELLTITYNDCPFSLSKSQKLLLFLICCFMPVLFLAVISYGLITNDMNANFMYGIKLNPYADFILSCLRCLLWFFAHPTWANLILFICSLLCQCVCKLMSHLTDAVEGCPSEEFTVQKQADILKLEARIEEAVFLIQKIFSLPSFFISTTHFCVCIVFLSKLAVRNLGKMSYGALCLDILRFVNSFCGLVAFLWVAGRMPVEADRLKEAFRTKIKMRMIRYLKADEICFERVLDNDTKYVLFGCVDTRTRKHRGNECECLAIKEALTFYLTNSQAMELAEELVVF